MACYYLVISSTHLSNGHFRGIKGVFRGPLHRNGTSLPGYAEKEKAITNALEDLKANFYCELCDKQYHKHQEFDNHINSYDHAHKQRLKELKQREFARNVASKSWKDEKKQEKALKRLHQLAELRKQSEWQDRKDSGGRRVSFLNSSSTGVAAMANPLASRGDPIFKTLRKAVEKHPQDGVVTHKDYRSTAGTKCTVACEVENLTLGSSGKHQELLQSKDSSHTESCTSPGDQFSPPSSEGSSGSPRAGVSFCFAKKASLKLESAASVFHENTEETNDCSKSYHYKAKQFMESFNSLASDETDTDEGKSVSVPQGQTDSTSTITQILRESEKDAKVPEITDSLQISNSSELLVSDTGLASSSKEIEKAKEFNEIGISPEARVSYQCQANNLYPQEKSCEGSDNGLIEHLTEFSLQKSVEDGHASALNCDLGVAETEKSLETSEIVVTSVEPDMNNSLITNITPKALSFLHVLSKDGSTSLQWPTELLLFTKTQPTISYGCNPLYFDFKLFKNTKTTTNDEANTDSNGEYLKNKIMVENEDSALISDTDTSIEKDDESLKPKKTKCSLDKLSPKNFESNTNNKEAKESGLNNSKYLNKNESNVSMYLDISQKALVAHNSSHSSKQKGCSKRHLDDCEKTVLSGINDKNSFSSLDCKAKKPKQSHLGLVSSEDKYDTQEYCKSSLKQYEYSNDINDCENEPCGCFGDKSNSHSRYLGCESDGSSLQNWRHLSSLKMYSGWHSTYLDTSNGSATSSYANTCSDRRSSDHKSRHHMPFFCERTHKSMEGCRNRKHNSTLSSDDNKEDQMFNTSSQRARKSKEKDVIITRKHKASKKNSRQSHPHHKCKSKQHRNSHPYYNNKYSDGRGRHFSEKSHLRQASSCERSGYRRSRCNSSGSFQNSKVYSLHKSNRESNIGADNYDGTVRKEDPLHSNIPNSAFYSRNYENRLSVNSLGKIAVDENKSSTVKLLSKRMQSKKEETANTHEGFSENCRMQMKNYSQNYFTVKLPPSVSDTTILPVHEKVPVVNEDGMDNDEASTTVNGVIKNRVGESQKYELTVTTHTDYDSCLFKDIIRIGTGCHYVSTEIQTAVEGQSNPLISQMQPFIQNCDPVPDDFPGAFQSKSYSTATDSTDTKEEQIRLHEENIRSSPREGNPHLCYDRTMQNYIGIDHELQDCNKSVSPLATHPITFSPDEIDKYRLLQRQAQQHMQKEFFSKHLKVLPTTGSAAFSTTAASALQPVPIQQHASITTIRHALLQHYACSASVHHHNSHLPLTHIYPHSHSHFMPISLSPLTPTIIPTHPTFLSGHPIHLLSTAAIHPSQLTLQSLPQTALIPTLIAPHLSTGASASIYFHPLFHPILHGQGFHHHHFGFGHPHL
ncbi:zinc finger protein 804B [Rhinatrema bivittatum]|uniref:zinc finger protein 804B n=1 Tax=Rhinatrema bivittatum TaxID=194408 RepID=UPI001127ACD1|nr:zinc finger protein 804B [Rhinatrema bivittatum]